MMLKNVKDTDIKSFEELHSTIKSTIYNTIYEAFLYKYDPSKKTGSLEAISNDILKRIFTGE